MTSKIFKSIIAVAIVVLMTGFAIITGVLYQYFGTVQEAQLKDELSLAVNATEQLGEEYLKNLDSERYRLTWIAADGSVIFDSHADEKTMENHAEREEIQEAFITGQGSSTRKSDTLTEQTIYEAMRLSDGSVLRISVSRATALKLVLGLLQPIIVVLLIAIAFSAWLAHHISRKLMEPLNAVDLENPLENEVYEELSPLLHRIHAQQLEIYSQMAVLKQKQEEFDQITANMKEALVLLDHTGRILSINPAAQVLFDANSNCEGEDFVTVERRQNMRNALEEAEQNGSCIFRDKKNGREYQFDLGRIDSEGVYKGMVILAFDITEQVNAEKHRREFTANVSHELKTPLQTIIGSAELMESGVVKEENIPRFVGHIRKEASRLVTLIDDIIRLSQLDENAELPEEPVSLKEVSEEVCEILSDAAGLKNVSLEVTGDTGLITGARKLLYEIVYNLCDNAIKYNVQGGNVKISVSEESGKVCLTVQDSGIGIAPEEHSKIFERFYRVDKSHSKQSGGTGLGLSIVKHAVQYHHGEIAVKSEINSGAAITVSFKKKETN
ncbi:MAG: GHKL domain-containing protein [Firmicutes bacterium]|jgi:two-component system phosphate regulon sensor histidine kinase PhoR|nr:GHKL domain-containing protein [Bacillota bacterium]